MSRSSVWTMAALALGAAPAAAQISPGPLSRAHEALEGHAGCNACHQPTEGVAAAKCLACHRLLAARVAGHQGLHASEDYRECKTCHVEHQGKSTPLVWWGKAGLAAFGHTRTGYALQGKHGALACTDCHQARFVKLSSEELRAGAASASRTYLGLGTNCRSCHADAHQGQFGDQGCDSCHGQDAWKPAVGFDHGRTVFPLTGRHSQTPCEKCHVAVSAIGMRDFKAALPRDCVGCHRDPHENHLGSDCARCHQTSGWQAYDAREFDHASTGYALTGKHAGVGCDKCHGNPAASGSAFVAARSRDCAGCHRDVHLGRYGVACATCHTPKEWKPQGGVHFDHASTGYPLRGRHLTVGCEKCHAPGKPPRLAHGACADCHRDPHQGQFARRDDRGACEACHDLAGFKPARFDLAEHEKTSYPLAGAHLAVPCDACHRPLDARAGPAAARYRFGTTRCADCHRDPHKGEVDKRVAQGGCESCHRVASWRALEFDHQETRYPLVAAHARAACAACHKLVEVGTARERTQLTGLALDCAGCHHDPHAAQFTPSNCERCHQASDLSAGKFDHDRDASFPLAGAHAKLACAACHPAERRGEQAFVRYKPLARACLDCHAAPRRPEKVGAS